MINVTRLWTGLEQPADALRYGRGGGAPTSAGARRPIVVWNMTRRCNLECVHCYTDSSPRDFPGELGGAEARALIEDLAGYGIPALLLSGGEPLMHREFFELASHARSLGLRLTLSTNGTLIDRVTAERLCAMGFSYIGISLDGIGPAHDAFRQRAGAFDRAVAAFRHCREIGQKVGLRLTLTRHTVGDLERILDFIEAEGIPRVCFYHLVPSGRGGALQILRAEETREAVDRIIDRAGRWVADGGTREVLTVDQPADGPHLLMRLRRERPERAAEVESLLRWNGGGAHGSGVGLANIDWLGRVHPDQFWQDHTLGDVRRERFSEIWSRGDDAILAGLRDRLPLLKGRCGSCRFRELCGGGFRARAWHATGDPWAADPGCYLSDEEIAGG